MLETWDKTWPSNSELVAYVDEIPTEKYSDRIRFEILENRNPELKHFKHRHKSNKMAHGILFDDGYTFLLDAIRFSHKVFALTHAILWDNKDADICIWLDADSVIHSPVSNEEIESILDPGFWAGEFNRDNNYPETGFLIFSVKHPKTKYFTQLIRNFYTCDMIFTLEKWTDCHVYQKVFAESVKLGHPVYSLSGKYSNTAHPIIHVLGHFLDHLKGPRKADGRSNKTKKDLTIKREEAYWND